MSETKIQVGPKANNNFVIVCDSGTSDETWFAEYDGLPRERILAGDAEDILARKNRLACQRYFPMHGFHN